MNKFSSDEVPKLLEVNAAEIADVASYIIALSAEYDKLMHRLKELNEARDVLIKLSDVGDRV